MAIEDALVLGQDAWLVKSVLGRHRRVGCGECGVPRENKVAGAPEAARFIAVMSALQEMRRDVIRGRAAAVPLALGRYQQNRVLRAAAVQGMSRASSAILFQHVQHVHMTAGAAIR